MAKETSQQVFLRVQLLALAVIVATGLPLALAADVADPWAEMEAELDLEARVRAVSDGDLRFLEAERVEGKHVHQNRIAIDESSLADGWVGLTQCHEGLDAVPAAQIVFKPGRIRALEVLEATRIGSARVEGDSVQLEDIAPGARLCLRGESRALHRLGEGQVRLRNGPYMRRFLDGYYPMRVVLDISYPAERLVLAGHSPAEQEGFAVQAQPGSLAVDAAFEGRLVTCFDFCTDADAGCAAFAQPCAQE